MARQEFDGVGITPVETESGDAFELRMDNRSAKQLICCIDISESENLKFAAVQKGPGAQHIVIECATFAEVTVPANSDGSVVVRVDVCDVDKESSLAMIVAPGAAAKACPDKSGLVVQVRQMPNAAGFTLAVDNPTTKTFDCTLILKKLQNLKIEAAPGATLSGTRVARVSLPPRSVGHKFCAMTAITRGAEITMDYDVDAKPHPDPPPAPAPAPKPAAPAPKASSSSGGEWLLESRTVKLDFGAEMTIRPSKLGGYEIVVTSLRDEDADCVFDFSKSTNMKVVPFPQTTVKVSGMKASVTLPGRSKELSLVRLDVNDPSKEFNVDYDVSATIKRAKAAPAAEVMPEPEVNTLRCGAVLTLQPLPSARGYDIFLENKQDKKYILKFDFAKSVNLGLQAAGFAGTTIAGTVATVKLESQMGKTKVCHLPSLDTTKRIEMDYALQTAAA